MSPNQPVRKRVLIAEDDAAISGMLAKVLGASYDVVCAADGVRALELCRAGPPPDLLLLDVMMPGLDGYGVAAGARAVPGLKSVPIIFLTAKTAHADIVKGIQHGAKHYIQKPFKIDDVVAKVRKVLGE